MTAGACGPGDVQATTVLICAPSGPSEAMVRQRIQDGSAGGPKRSPIPRTPRRIVDSIRSEWTVGCHVEVSRFVR